jgi:hypothetical protein
MRNPTIDMEPRPPGLQEKRSPVKTIVLVLLSIIVLSVIVFVAYTVGYSKGSEGIVNQNYYENTTYVIRPNQIYQNSKIGVSVLCQKACQEYRICDSNNQCVESPCKDWPLDAAATLVSSAPNGTVVQARDCECG